MVDIVITAASVVKGAGAKTKDGIAGETITAGQALYLAAATNKWMKADADAGTAAARTATAIALNGAAVNQEIEVQYDGIVAIGATLTPGLVYYLSGLAAGGICPVADIGAAEYVCVVGAALTTANLDLFFHYTGVAL